MKTRIERKGKMVTLTVREDRKNVYHQEFKVLIKRVKVDSMQLENTVNAYLQNKNISPWIEESMVIHKNQFYSHPSRYISLVCNKIHTNAQKHIKSMIKKSS